MVLVLLLFATEIASAQSMIKPSFRRDGPVTITITPAARAATAITGLPYSGERTSERILSDGTHMSESVVREFRDSLGRTREEHSGQGFGPLTIVEILDPVTGLDWVLDPANQVGYRMVLQLKTRAASQGLRPCNPGRPATTQTMPNGNVSTSIPLGSQTIQGIGVCGQRITITGKDGTPGLNAENWLSREDVGGVVLSKTDLQGGNNISQLVNVKFSEPDPELFAPPLSYRVIDETTAFMITGAAPLSVTAAGPPATAVRTVAALTGIPWSGDLMSGNTLLSRQFRDSLGRTRREQMSAKSASVLIVDVVGGYSYTLDTSTHTATP